MLIIGLLLIAAALLVGSAILLDATERQTVEVFGVSVDTTDAGVFVAGAVTMLTLLIGVWITQLALARARRRRAEMKSLKRDRTESVSRLEEEKAELAAQLERERVAREAADRDSRQSHSSTYSDSARSSHAGTHDGVTGATAADESEARHEGRGSGLKSMFGKGESSSSSRDDDPGHHEQRDGGAGLTKR